MTESGGTGMTDGTPEPLEPAVSGLLVADLAGVTFGLCLPSLHLRPWMLIAYGVFFLLFTTVLRNPSVKATRS